MTIEQRTAEIVSAYEPPRALALAGHDNQYALRKLLYAAEARIKQAAASLADTPEALNALSTANDKVSAGVSGLFLARTDFKAAAARIAEAEQAVSDLEAFII